MMMVLSYFLPFVILPAHVAVVAQYYDDFLTCSSTICSGFYEFEWPEGFGDAKDTDLDLIGNHEMVAGYVNCICEECLYYPEVQAWPANADGVACAAAKAQLTRDLDEYSDEYSDDDDDDDYNDDDEYSDEYVIDDYSNYDNYSDDEVYSVDDDYADDELSTFSMTLMIVSFVSFVSSVFIAIYGFKILWIDWHKSIERKVNIGTISILVSSIVASLISSILMLINVEESASENEILGFNFFWGVSTTILTLYAVFRFTTLAVKGLALAGEGIAGTRKKWFVMFEKFRWIVYVVIVPTFMNLKGRMDFMMLVSTSSTSCLLCIGYSLLGLRLRSLLLDSNMQQNIKEACTRMVWVLVVIVIWTALVAIQHVLWILNMESDNLQLYPLIELSGYAVIYMIIRFIAKTNENNKAPEPTQDPDTIYSTSSADLNQNSTTTTLQPTRPIYGGDGSVIGHAPHATRPMWLRNTGAGQSQVEPLKWSISLGSLLQFLYACVDTETWTSLATIKRGAKHICMHDLNAHFVKPWTQDTGCSIAGLMDENQGLVELMISHSWTGSVIETISILESLPGLFFMPNETRIFFCTMCMYQPEDNHRNGLTIKEQLELDPFSKIIKEDPKWGMHVFHTTVAEVYERLWCVHEMNEAVHFKVKVYGAFDMSIWDDKKLKGIIKKTETSKATCQGDDDQEMLTRAVNKRGGFNKLDKKIKAIRRQSMADLVSAHTFKWLFSADVSSIERFVYEEV